LGYFENTEAIINQSKLLLPDHTAAQLLNPTQPSKPTDQMRSEKLFVAQHEARSNRCRYPRRRFEALKNRRPIFAA
jgi:hypothetical protein